MEDETEQYRVIYVDGVDSGPKQATWIQRAGKAKVTYATGDAFEGRYNSQGLRHGHGLYTWNTAASHRHPQCFVP